MVMKFVGEENERVLKKSIALDGRVRRDWRGGGCGDSSKLKVLNVQGH